MKQLGESASDRGHSRQGEAIILDDEEDLPPSLRSPKKHFVNDEASEQEEEEEELQETKQLPQKRGRNPGLDRKRPLKTMQKSRSRSGSS